ncbi:PAS domain S-box protein [Rhodoferax sp.]|uniref:PAS domain-containing sensor histidine kinase n=1 Tax=Rhodoferax sp. TaxID=50421 RepID=UPI00285243BC|nr:PAS domain S-box protein [Rhodoferax sp.]MDR3367637.1 PAS domain S-box protein [Rhodoferax sp.]
MDSQVGHPATPLSVEERLVLRQRAELHLAGQSAFPSAEQETLSPEAMQHLLRELEVHQIELEMQNEELRRTQAERDLAETRYFDFYDLAPVGYVTVSEQGLILQSNLTAAAMLGVARSQLTLQPISRFIEREDQDTYNLLRKQLFEKCPAQSCELRMHKHDGSPFFARMDAIAAPGDDGAQVLRLVLVDITSSKQAAIQRNAMDQAILNSVNAAVVVLDQYGVIRLVNEPWQRFVLENCVKPRSSAPNVGVGTNYPMFCLTNIHVHPHTATAAHDGIQGVLAGVLPSFNLEYVYQLTNQRRWFSMCALPIGRDPKHGITITHTDITTYKQAEVDLRVAAVAFETQEAIAVMDSQRRILRVNQVFTEITGYSAQELLGKTTKILRSKRQSESSFEDIWTRTINEGKEQGGRWLQNKNGKDFFAHGTTTAVKNQQGQITHYVITFSDQTLKQQQDQQRMQHEAAHRDALVREVHHRIKNNLQGIGGLLQQFASQKPEIAEQMQLVAGHLNGISIIHGLQGRHDKSRVRLCELTREIAQATSTIWQTEITVDIPPHWIFRVVVEKEAVSMALVLNELMVNAVKHGGKAHGQVNVAIRQGLGADGVELSIVNKGHLHKNKDIPAGRQHGLQLIESLRPREGVTVTLTQRGDQVHTLLQIGTPVLTLDTEN